MIIEDAFFLVNLIKNILFALFKFEYLAGCRNIQQWDMG